MDIQKNNGSKCLLSHEPDKQVNGEGKSSSRSSSSSSSGSSCIKLKDIGSSGDGKTLKIRKPYTITKQREKWTEEEHNKFIEALQFYGRDWRRIEEYVGTKTAVQIRSHAQKFFSKVAQEAASNGSSGTSKPFEIPPPRPKRKPAHPYPRKLGSSSSQTSRILPQLGVYSLQIHKVPEKDGRSPTSVLYSSGSDKSSGGSSNHQGNEVQGGSRTTPGSANAKLTKGDKHMVREHAWNPCPITQYANSQCEHSLAVISDNSNMDQDLDGLPGGKVTSEEDSLAEVAAIKLFGKVVLADHSAKVCPSEASSMAPEIKPPCPVHPDAQHAHPNDACNCLDCPRQHHHEIAIICGDDEDAGVYILDELNKSLISGNLHG